MYQQATFNTSAYAPLTIGQVDPAAGAPLFVYPVQPLLMVYQAVYFHFVTSAAVANRFLFFWVIRAGRYRYRFNDPVPIPASTDVIVNIVAGGPYIHDAANLGSIHLPLPLDLEIDVLDNFLVYATNIDAADQISDPQLSAKTLLP